MVFLTPSAGVVWLHLAGGGVSGAAGGGHGAGELRLPRPSGPPGWSGPSAAPPPGHAAQSLAIAGPGKVCINKFNEKPDQTDRHDLQCKY